VYSLMLTCRACGVELYAYLLPFDYAKRQTEASVI
jgi:hypothetical protein